MNYELFIALRYLKAKPGRGFISIVSLISVLGVAVGVCALIVVLSVMSGFDQKLKEVIVGANAHVTVEADGVIENGDSLIAKLSQMPHVTAASSYINSQAMVSSGDYARGVVFKGVDPIGEKKVTNIGEYLTAGSLDLAQDEVIVGSELAKYFGLGIGDGLSLISPVSGRKFDLKISGIFTSTKYDYDLNLVFLHLNKAQQVLGYEDEVSGIGIRLDNEMRADRFKLKVQRELGFPYWVRSWMDMNKNFFDALKLEKTAMFIILTLIVIVAALNIASTLIVMVTEKTKDIGILKALGATRSSITKIFRWEGFLIGAVGTAIGGAAGFLLCHLLSVYRFIKLPPDIYYIDSLPVLVRFGDSAAVIAAALLISLLATIYPARQAARLDPVQAIRYE